jgi:nitrate/TMAO reductase-like tetraheme cytochrome c subunit
VGEGEGQTESASPVGQGEEPPKRRGRHRRRNWVFIIIAAVIVVLIGAAFATAEYTSRSAFCDTCHEMDPYYASWETSVHNQAECVNCHIPHGIIPFIQTKLFSFREIYVHFASTPEAPLAVTREIPDSNCLSCHPDPGEVTLGNVAFSHDMHESQDCIDCHVRLVHRTVNPPYYVPPGDMSSCLACHDGTTAPSQCSLCHTPPHEARGECSNCHTQEGWAASAAAHPFPLEGAHATLACTDCHVSKPGVENIPGTELAQADPACVSCHAVEHPGLTDCANCHTPEGWTPATFEHPFALVGAHASLACTDCHVSEPGVENMPGTEWPVPDPACVSCHGDQHGGLTDCADCHTPEGWKPATFTHPQVGEHVPNGEIPLDCASCHPSGFATNSCSCHGGNAPGGD